MAATIAFTLPISCQICLGRVKEPVVCSNQHVFCQPCIKLWLEKNHQCPACRVPISADNPCRPVLGGLNPDAAAHKEESFSNRELRRARLELIYKDYENELERLKTELESERLRGDELAKQIRSHARNGAGESFVSSEMQSWEFDASLILKNKLRETAAQNSRLKSEFEKIKKELSQYKEENSLLQMENQRMRLDLANRSPIRFGRFTVAALENKLAASEKEVQQLKKALENSDLYIEELEKQLANPDSNLQKEEQQPHVPSDDFLTNGEKTDDDSSVSTLESSMKIFSNKAMQLDEEVPFVLEVPSLNSSLSESLFLDSEDLKKQDGGEQRETNESNRVLAQEFNVASVSDTVSVRNIWQASKELLLNKKSSKPRSLHLEGEMDADAKEPTVDSCKKRLRFARSDSFSNPETKSLFKENGFTVLTKTSLDDAFTGSASTARQQSASQFYGSKPSNSSWMEGIKRNNQNSEITPEIADCLRLMDEAERKVRGRMGEPSSLP